MGPTAPAPLTRAAARRTSSIGQVDRSDVRARLMHVLAVSGGAFAGAFLVLGVGSLAGVSTIDSPSDEVSSTEQIAVPTPHPTTVTRSPSVAPSDDATTPDPEPVAPAVIAPVVAEDSEAEAATPDPSESTPDPVAAEPAPETGPGKSASAPGRNKPPTTP